MADAELSILIKARNEAKAEFDKLNGQVKTLQGSTGGLNSTFKSLGGSMLGALGIATTMAAAFAAAVKVTKESTIAASNLEETTNKIDVVFGEAAGSVMEFGRSSATALGMSENAALSAAGVYGNLFRAMGIGTEQAAEMSTELVKLAADLASFNNMDPTLVLDKLRAGLSGEVEPLRTLGVNLNEVIIKQKAMSMGMYDGAGAISAAAKAMASYQLILEQTELAQGDFTRTSEGFANQQRILEAQMENLKTSWGVLTLPVALRFVGWANTVVEAELEAQEFGNQMEELGYTFLFSGLYIKDWKITTAAAGKEMLNAGAAVEVATDRFDKMSTVLDENSNAFGKAASSANDYGGSIDDLKTIMAGGFGKETKNYTEKLGDLKDEAAELQGQIDELEGKKYLTTAQKKQLEELKTQLGEVTGAMSGLAAEHSLAMKQMAANLLIQKVGSDGFTQNELNNIASIMKAWGLWDDQTAAVLSYLSGIDLDMSNLDITGLSNDIALLTGTPQTIKFEGETTPQLDKILELAMGGGEGINAPVVDLDTYQAMTKAEQLIARMDEIKDRTATVTIDFNIGGGIGAAEKALNIDLNGNGEIGSAVGGHRGGRTLVGELGPEIVDLPPGSWVHSNRNSQSMGGGGGGVTVNLTYAPAMSLSDKTEMETKLIPLIQRALSRTM